MSWRKMQKNYNHEKANTNFACNYCLATYDNLKCKTTDLLQAMHCIAWK